MAPLGPLLATALILVPKKFLVPVSVYSSTHTGTGVDFRGAGGQRPFSSDTQGGKICLAPTFF